MFKVSSFDCSHIGASRQFGVYLQKMASSLKTRKFLPRISDPTHTFEDELEVDLAGRINLKISFAYHKTIIFHKSLEVHLFEND